MYTEALRDPNWVLLGMQLNEEALEERGESIWSIIMKAIDTMQDSEAMDSLHLEGGQLTSDDSDEADRITEALEPLISQYMTWRTGDSGRMEMVVRDRATLYLLMNIEPTEQEVRGMAILLGDHWYTADPSLVSEDGGEGLDLSAIMGDILGDLIAEALNFVFYVSDGTGETELPTAGLENLMLDPLETPATTEAVTAE